MTIPTVTASPTCGNWKLRLSVALNIILLGLIWHQGMNYEKQERRAEQLNGELIKVKCAQAKLFAAASTRPEIARCFPDYDGMSLEKIQFLMAHKAYQLRDEAQAAAMEP